MAKKQLSPAAARKVALGLIIASLIFAALAAYSASRTIRFLRTAERVPGIVAELIPRRGNKGGTTWAPRFEFTEKTGKPQSVVSSFSSSPAAYSEGENVEILYDPNDIKGAETRGISNWLGTIIPGIFCLVLGTISTVMLLKIRRPKYT